MIKKLIKRGFSARLYSWGSNFNNLGYSPQSELEASLPKQLGLASSDEIAKFVSADSESAVLTKSGQVQIFGSNKIISQAQRAPSVIDWSKVKAEQQNLVDIDVDKSHAVFLNAQGQVWEFSSKGLALIKLPAKARLVAAGNGVSLAVLTGPENEDLIYAWGRPKNGGSIFTMEFPMDREPFDLTPISGYIKKAHTAIKKLKVVNSGAVVLLQNGELISWGNNARGNLGVPRSELSLVDHNIFQPQKPVELAHLTGKVSDFDLSDNLLVLLMENGTAYFCGLDNILSLRKIELPKNLPIEKVGCQHNKFFVIASNGKVFSNKPFDEDPYQKYYGEVDLYELDGKHFGNGSVQAISGKYQNAFALCK